MPAQPAVRPTSADRIRAARWFAEHGFDEQLGARPMARLIQKEIKDPLTDDILFGSLKKGGKVKVELKGEKIFLEFAK